MGNGHAKLGPSSAKRWLTCPGSVPLIERVEEELGPEPVNEYAELGTALHEAAEECLVKNREPIEMVGRTFYGIEVTEADVDRFADYVYLVRELPGQTYYEQKVTVIKDSVWGTADAVNIHENRLTICDLKTGYVQVDAEDNPQLLCYALGAYMKFGAIFEITEIEMIISQPSTEHESRCLIGINKLNEFYQTVVDAIEAIKLFPDRRVPDAEGCRWCRARGTCPELRELAKIEAAKDFKAMDLMALADAVQMLPMLEHYISGVKARSHETLMNGDEIPGFKLVEGRRSRIWNDEAGVEKYLSRKMPKFKQNAYTHKFKSPAQIEKEIKKLGEAMFRPVPKLTEFIETRKGKPTVVPVTDKREPLVYGESAAADFADVTEPSGS